MRVFALDPTTPKKNCLVGIGLVSVIVSWPSDVALQSLVFVVAPKRFNVVCLFLSSLPHSKYDIGSFFGDVHGRLGLEFVPKLFYFSIVRRVFVFVVLLPLSTANVACPRFVHTDEPWRFRTMLTFYFCLVPTSPYALGDNMDVSRVVSLRCSRGMTSFFVVVGLSLPLGVLPFYCVEDFLLLGVLLPTTNFTAL